MRDTARSVDLDAIRSRLAKRQEPTLLTCQNCGHKQPLTPYNQTSAPATVLGEWTCGSCGGQMFGVFTLNVPAGPSADDDIRALLADRAALAGRLRAVHAEEEENAMPEYVPDVERLIAQAQAIGRILAEAGVGACPIPEGVLTLLHRAEAAEARLRAVQPEGVPGRWKCQTCGFQLTKAILRASDGAVGVDRSTVQDICPSDGTSLRQLTWEEDAADANRVAFEQMKRADALETRLAVVEAERDKWLGNFNRSEQFQDGPTKRAEAAEARLQAVEAQLETLVAAWRGRIQCVKLLCRECECLTTCADDLAALLPAAGVVPPR